MTVVLLMVLRAPQSTLTSFDALYTHAVNSMIFREMCHLVTGTTLRSAINNLYKANLRQESHYSKFGIFELLVEKETFEDAILTGVVS